MASEASVFRGSNAEYYEATSAEIALWSLSPLDVLRSLLGGWKAPIEVEAIRREMENLKRRKKRAKSNSPDFVNQEAKILFSLRIKGVGKKTANALIKRFGSISNIRAASVEEVDQVRTFA